MYLVWTCEITWSMYCCCRECLSSWLFMQDIINCMFNPECLSFILLCCSSCLRGSDLGRRRFYILGFYSILSCILWRLFMLLNLSYVDDMTLLSCIWFRCDFMLELLSCMTMFVIIRKSDDYFLCIYLNCMIYCLIRNKALQRTPYQVKQDCS